MGTKAVVRDGMQVSTKDIGYIAFPAFFTVSCALVVRACPSPGPCTTRLGVLNCFLRSTRPGVCQSLTCVVLQIVSDMVPAYIWTGKHLSKIWRQDPELVLTADVLGIEFHDVTNIACDVLYVDSYTRNAFTLYTIKEPISHVVGKGVELGELKVSCLHALPRPSICTIKCSTHR